MYVITLIRPHSKYDDDDDDLYDDDLYDDDFHDDYDDFLVVYYTAGWVGGIPGQSSRDK